MDFALTEEQAEIKNLAQKIIGDQTDNEQLKKIDAQDVRLDKKLWSDLAEAGLLGIAIDEQYGGMGFGFESLCLLVEEVGNKMAAVPVIPVLVSAALPIQKYASQEIKSELLSAVAQGKSLVTAALIEPGSENPLNPSTIATADTKALKLNGVKHCVPFAKQASHILMTAKQDGELVLVLVAVDSDGITLDGQNPTSGETQYQVTLKDVMVNEPNIIARGEAAVQATEWTSQITSAALGAMAVGVTDKMVRLTAEYTSQREQFGVPIATFQAVAHGAASAYIDSENLRTVTQQVVSLLDHGLEAKEQLIIAKIWCGDICARVSQSAQHLHGGIGVDRDYPLFRYCLWAKQLELTMGSSAQHLHALGDAIAEQFKTGISV